MPPHTYTTSYVINIRILWSKYRKYDHIHRYETSPPHLAYSLDCIAAFEGVTVGKSCRGGQQASELSPVNTTGKAGLYYMQYTHYKKKGWLDKQLAKTDP